MVTAGTNAGWRGVAELHGDLDDETLRRNRCLDPCSCSPDPEGSAPLVHRVIARRQNCAHAELRPQLLSFIIFLHMHFAQCL